MPFSDQFRVSNSRALQRKFFRDYYGKGDVGEDDSDKIPGLPNAPWRHIDEEWLYAADSLALKLNQRINNTSLVGDESSAYPNLSWMGRDAFGQEFTPMIPAVNEWAMTKNDPPWCHPLPSIKQALEHKAQGRTAWA